MGLSVVRHPSNVALLIPINKSQGGIRDRNGTHLTHQPVTGSILFFSSNSIGIGPSQGVEESVKESTHG